MRLAAFLRRQSPSWMVRAPTMTSKPPSNLMRTASSLSEVPFASIRILIFGRRSVTFVGPAKDNNNKDGNARDSLLRRTMLFVWYSIARVNQLVPS